MLLLVRGVNQHNRLPFVAEVRVDAPHQERGSVLRVSGTVHSEMDHNVSDSWAGMFMEVERQLGFPVEDRARIDYTLADANRNASIR